MKNQTILLALVIMFFSTLTGCELIGGIFKTGMGIGIFAAIIVIGIVFFFVSKFRGK